ncbi:MAG TPA: rhomboid family intramembrane serine protease [Steroidobacteraceae bacterium]|nr:rhomboid family intramembrane serine protease [Steroidobacteraceae bacterium]
MDQEPPWIEIFRSAAPQPCDERALVLLAVGIPPLMSAEHGDFQLLVAEPDVARAELEIGRYLKENRPRPRPVPYLLHPGALVSALLYALLLFMVAVASARGLLGRDWYDLGVLDGARVRGGELWRAVTALTLHADLSHLAANIGFGAFFGALAARVYGSGVAWLLIVLAAGAANLANAALMAPGRASLGASTAVFAALGALAVARWPAATRRTRAGLAGAGLVAALVLLALLGTGDARTDILAHALGFLCGALFALPLRRFPAPRTWRAQRLAGALALGLVGLAWALAYWM